jgi:hypothetical protein
VVRVVIAVGAIGPKALTRWHLLALGQDDAALHDQLIKARSLFEDITTEGRRADWFEADERRETARSLRDLAKRRRDQRLKEAVGKVADAWDQAFALSPGTTGPMMRWSDHVTTPKEREQSAQDQAQFAKEADVAREGVEQVSVALDRLDLLERRVIGR